MIVIDTSSLVAIARREEDWLAHATALQAADIAVISPINYVGLGILLRRHELIADEASLKAWLRTLDVEVRDDVALSETALAAYLAYGKGFHPDGLNLADVFAYALSKKLNAPLLYKGDDFTRTDVRSVLQPT